MLIRTGQTTHRDCEFDVKVRIGPASGLVAIKSQTVGYSEVVRFKIVRLLCKCQCLDRSFPGRDMAMKVIIFL